MIGDGVDDLVVGADEQDGGQPDGGAVYLVRGPIRGPQQRADAEAVLLGAYEGGDAGVAPACVVAAA